MPLLNYTTRISADKSVGEIMQALGRAGATDVTIQYDILTSRPKGVFFGLSINGNEIGFKLPVNIPGIFYILNNDHHVPPRFRTKEHAEKVAWRIVKDWIKSQMAYIEAGQATMPELFFPHATNQNGQTFFEQFEEFVALPSGDEQ